MSQPLVKIKLKIDTDIALINKCSDQNLSGLHDY